MHSFDFDMRTKVVLGAGALNRIGLSAQELGCRRALLVTDPGIRNVGYPDRASSSLQSLGVTVQIFDGARENPSTEQVNEGVAVAQGFSPDLLIGLGGGSSMDCAKGINFVLTNGGRMQDYWGVNLAKKPMLPMIAVPTTAGTGSEMQSFALISDAETHVKMACGDKKASCVLAILDPELTMTQPHGVTAVTGIDALSHAIETYVSRRRNSVSTLFSREAWRLLSANFLRVLKNPEDLEARSAMQLGAAWAGLAIENSMLGAAHSMANPLTARFDTIHGHAVGISLPHVIRFNGEQFNPWYEELLLVSSSSGITPRPAEGALGLADFIERIVAEAGLANRLSECGVTEDAVPQLAQEAAKQWTAQFNPRAVSADNLRTLYERAF